MTERDSDPSDGGNLLDKLSEEGLSVSEIRKTAESYSRASGRTPERARADATHLLSSLGKMVGENQEGRISADKIRRVLEMEPKKPRGIFRTADQVEQAKAILLKTITGLASDENTE